jgi:hypothetical protein
LPVTLRRAYRDRTRLEIRFWQFSESVLRHNYKSHVQFDQEPLFIFSVNADTILFIGVDAFGARFQIAPPEGCVFIPPLRLNASLTRSNRPTIGPLITFASLGVRR